uniref:ABC transporter domain-containing protein n=1 Tax=Ditylenchus dipsaci TaxID=166011 RepID=A0A915E014_9BILA
MELSWHGITATPKNPREIDIGLSTHEDYILNNVDGLAVPGEVLAIMGASGSVRINGFEIDKPTLRKVSAYAQQKDLLIGTMTVIEHLRFMAALRTSPDYTADEQEEKVQAIMAELGLSHIADTIIGWPHRLKGISGGERKRLSLASEILSSPSVLLCDEPTSGLDAFFTHHVIQVLKDLARRENMTIVVTIHQPSSRVYEMFDKLCLLAMGQVIYLGPPNEVYKIFGSAGFPVPEFTNPAEHVIHCLSLNDDDTIEDHKERIQKIRYIYNNSSIAKTYDARLMGSISEGERLGALNQRETLQGMLLRGALN